MNPTDKKYFSLVEEWNAAGANIAKEEIDYSTNWWEISRKEAKRHKIDPALNNALCLAYTRYQNMIDMSDSGIWEDEDGEHDRKVYQLYMAEKKGELIQWSDVAAARFMSEVCKLPYNQCTGYIAFVEAAMEREGLLTRTPRLQ